MNLSEENPNHADRQDDIETAVESLTASSPTGALWIPPKLAYWLRLKPAKMAPFLAGVDSFGSTLA
jgi:hypothetical protein